MKISLIQMNVAEDKRVNLAHAYKLAAKCEKSDIIMLPEMFVCPYNSESFVKNAEPCGEAATQMLKKTAAETGAYVIGGSIPESDGGRIYNTCLIISPSGEIIGKHRKAHLFDVDIKGRQRFFESDTLTKGESATVFDTEFGRAGVCICFDIRFPGFISDMRRLGMNMLFVPAAFNMTTGPMHWELLFRARAVDNQIFTFGCAPARDNNAGYVSYANSIAVDPWGRILARAGEGETVLTVEVDTDEVNRVREQIPIGNGI